MIGDQWLQLTDDQERRRIEDLSDYVRIEIESALKRDIPVVPVLVEEAKMPGANELPESIRDLAFRNAAEIGRGREQKPQIDRLVSDLAASLKPNIPQPEVGSATSNEKTSVAPRLPEEIPRRTKAAPKWQIITSSIVLAASSMVLLVSVMLLLTSNGRVSWDEAGPIVIVSLMVAIASAVWRFLLAPHR
jgi:hypothetical protein